MQRVGAQTCAACRETSKKTSSFFTQPERQTKIWRFFYPHLPFYGKNSSKHSPFFNFFGFSVHFFVVLFATLKYCWYICNIKQQENQKPQENEIY